MISRSLKVLAKELDIPVVALSQLRRSVEERGEDKRPTLSDLRVSGALEQDADVVIFIHRPELYGIGNYPDGEKTEGVAEVMISKQRNGPTGEIKLTFVKQYARFEDLENFRLGPSLSNRMIKKYRSEETRAKLRIVSTRLDRKRAAK